MSKRSKKRRQPDSDFPSGAEILFAFGSACDIAYRGDGLVRFSLQSGGYTRNICLQLHDAMRLHHGLGKVFDAAREEGIVRLARSIGVAESTRANPESI